MKFVLIRLLSLLAATASNVASGSVHSPRAHVKGMVTVELGNLSGVPQHLASGFLYGIPIKQNQVPDHFYTDMGFNYGRSGGGSQPEPARGWVYGREEFINRFAAPASYYKTVRKYDAKMQLLIADVWGADGHDQIAMPGDHSDWSSYDDFLTTLFSAINDNEMATALDLEPWNEPDLEDVFWQRNQTQYLDMWGRGFPRFRAAFPNNKIIGPCSSSNPSSDNKWLENYLQFIKTNNSVPDYYCWHLELESGDDLEQTIPAWNKLLEKYALPQRPIICNEYAIQREQQPAGATWWISRLERYNVRGLRGNWLANGSYDYFAGLLGKPNAGTLAYNATQAGYWNNGEYNVYKYYNLNMTGSRAQTTASPDGLFDVYSTVDSANNNVKILAGSRLEVGTWDILVSGLQNIGLPPCGSVSIQTYKFDYAGCVFGDVPQPVDLGVHTRSYCSHELVISVTLPQNTSYAFEVAK